MRRALAAGALIAGSVFGQSFYLSNDVVPRKETVQLTIDPTRAAFEAALAALEGGERCFAFASGMAAETTLLLTLRPGDHVLLADDVYGGTYRLLSKVLGPWGLAFDTCDLTDPASVRDAVRPGQRAVGEPRRAHDGPIETARAQDPLHLRVVFRHISQERPPGERIQEAVVLEEHGHSDHQEPAKAGRLHGSDGAPRAIRDHRIAAGPGRSERRQHGLVTRQRAAQFVRIARIAADHGQPLAGRAELFRRAYERCDGMAAPEGLLDERPAGATGRAEDEEGAFRGHVQWTTQRSRT